MANNSSLITTSTNTTTVLDDVVFLEDPQMESNDISFWEFVNPSDVDDSDDESLLSVEENGFVSWYSIGDISLPKSQIDEKGCNFVVGCGGFDVNSIGFESLGCFDGELDVNSVGFESDCARSHGMHAKIDSFDDRDHDDDDDDGDHVDDDGYGLDDELVPWNVSGRLERQRMRKLGKRVFAKMSHSKRNPCRFVKPGCVHGKHGLGIKAA